MESRHRVTNFHGTLQTPVGEPGGNDRDNSQKSNESHIVIVLVAIIVLVYTSVLIVAIAGVIMWPVGVIGILIEPP